MKSILLSAGCLALLGTSTHAALTAGDIAIIGRTNNGTPDTFAFVALTDISAGEEIYFTDNGWSAATSLFRSPSGTDGDGNEGLLKWTSTLTIPAGSIIATNTSSASYSFTTSGLVPGAASGSFANLALSTSGDQIYAFQAPSSLPLQNPANHLFVLDDTNSFENATTSGDGNITPGLSLGTTAVTLNIPTAGTIKFNTGALTSGTKGEWLAAIGNSANWTSGGSLPSGSVTVVPEPASALLGSLGILALLRRRRIY